MMGGRYWTERELGLVRSLYPVSKWPELLRALPGRSKASIRCQVISLSIKRERNSRTPWTGAEIERLRNLYPNAPWASIEVAIPRHPRGSITHKAGEIGLRRDGSTKQSRYLIIRRLRELRRARGIRQAHLAGQIGIHTVQLAKWERGEQLPRLRGFFDWVEALGLKVELLKC